MDLVTAVTTDSTNDGEGPSSTIVPGQVPNVTDDLLILAVTQSLNNAGNVAAINMTTPAGWTLLTDRRDSELRTWIYYRRTTANDEQFPDVISDTVTEWSTSATVVTDVDWVNGGLAQHVENSGNGDMQSLDLTTNANGGGSAIVCLYSVERRNLVGNGFRYPQTRPQTIFLTSSSTGTSEGIDNRSTVAFDFVLDRSANFDAPFWEVNGGGDSMAFNIEVVVQGNIVPLQVSSLVEQEADANAFQTNANWVRDIVNSGILLDGTTLNTWTFDGASDVDPGTDQITITGHGMDESMVVYMTEGAGTAPTGLADDTFYFVQPVDANTISLCPVNEDTDANSDWYANNAVKLSPVDITADGSGTITLTEARMVNASTSRLDIFRGNNGNTSNIGPAPGSYIGDNGYNQNWSGAFNRFNAVADLSSRTLQFQFDINSGGGRLARGVFVLIDEDGDWINWTLWLRGVSANDIGPTDFQIDPGSSVVQSRAYQSAGTFDATRVRYFGVAVIGANNSTARFNNANSATSVLRYGGAFTIVNGEGATWEQLVELAESYTDKITRPSDLQITSTIPIAIGDGTNPVNFNDSEKSIAFPPLADGVTTFQNYVASLGVELNAGPGDTIRVANSQIGASVPFNFDVIADPTATVTLDGNAYVFPIAVLDADVVYNRQVFVGGTGVTDNGAEIRNSTFIVNDQIGADNGMIAWDGSTDIETTSFEADSSLTSGHAIVINTAGTYTFNALTFSGFGADASVTAAVYNNSGGAVTINISGGGSTPTVRNGVGASTTVVAGAQLELTGLQANSEVRAYVGIDPATAVEIAGIENSGTTFSFSQTEAGNDGFIVVHSLQYEYLRLDITYSASDQSIPVQQRFDRNYENP